MADRSSRVEAHPAALNASGEDGIDIFFAAYSGFFAPMGLRPGGDPDEESFVAEAAAVSHMPCAFVGAERTEAEIVDCVLETHFGDLLDRMAACDASSPDQSCVAVRRDLARVKTSIHAAQSSPVAAALGAMTPAARDGVCACTPLSDHFEAATLAGHDLPPLPMPAKRLAVPASTREAYAGMGAVPLDGFDDDEVAAIKTVYEGLCVARLVEGTSVDRLQTCFNNLLTLGEIPEATVYVQCQEPLVEYVHALRRAMRLRDVYVAAAERQLGENAK